MPFESFSVYDADLTGEGDINPVDFSELASQWMSGYTVPCPPADNISGDCRVDINDLTSMALQWLVE